MIVAASPQVAQIGQRPLFEPSWVLENADRVWEATLQHVYLTGMAVGAGLAIALVLSVVALRWRSTYGPIVAAGAVLYTVPSLALFAFLIPFVDRTTNAVIALTTYTILILVRNIVTAVDGVPREVVEAADGMGYRPVRRFVEIELPLALPVILAGVRVATVTVIGLVTSPRCSGGVGSASSSSRGSGSPRRSRR